MFLQLSHPLEPLPCYCLEMSPSTASEDEDTVVSRTYNSTPSATNTDSIVPMEIASCPSCGYQFNDLRQQGGGQQGKISLLPGLPAGVRFDPTDAELLEHLQRKARTEREGDGKCHPLIDEFIPTLHGENGICCTHPEKLPGVSTDGQIRHFFHRPSRAYTTGNRKRRKVDSDDGGETRWHKTGKTRSITFDGVVKGQKKILVLYTNYGKVRKPEKTNWIMHQYHLGPDDDEKDGELVVSKVFYQTQPRQSAAGSIAVKNSTPLGGVRKDQCPDLSAATVHFEGDVDYQRRRTL